MGGSPLIARLHLGGMYLGMDREELGMVDNEQTIEWCELILLHLKEAKKIIYLAEVKGE